MRNLGKTDIEVSTIGMGCWAIAGGGAWGAQEEADSIAAIRKSLDCGVNFFDTAEAYGKGYSEQLLAKAIGADSEKIVIGSKVKPGHAGSFDDLSSACERSLKYLNRDYIDVYYLHWPRRDVPAEDMIGWFGKLKESGKIRCFAVSNFGAGDLGDLLATGRCEVNQLPYNLIWRAIEYDIIPECVKNEISVTCYSPIMQGLLTGKFKSPDDVPVERARSRHFSCSRSRSRHDEKGQEELTFDTLRKISVVAEELAMPMGRLALAWLIKREGVASVLAGARNAEQAAQNAAAMTVDLGDDVVERLAEITAPLKKTLGTNPDMWQSQSRYR